MYISNKECLVFSKIEEDKPLNKYDLVYEGDEFRVFVKELREPYRVRLSLADNNVICLRNKDGILIQYYGWNTENRIDELLDMEPCVNIPSGKDIILEVDLSDEAYDVMRYDITNVTNVTNDLDENQKVFDIFIDTFFKFQIFEKNFII